MIINIQTYFEKLKQSVYDKISFEINEMTINDVVMTDLVKSHIFEPKSASFQNYYFKTLNNEEYYYENQFFREFKMKYSLQGIDNKFLDELEKRKKNILNDIRKESLAQLYFDNFNKAKIKHGDKIIEKNLGSFFSKLVHTFLPNDYCALDNPIKNYFELGNESFFISFFIISSVYKQWASDNKILIQEIKHKLKQADKQEIIKHEQLTDLKLLDLIFWSKANRK